jgi:hypothetical protein
MTRLVLTFALSTLALASVGQSASYVHRVAIVFEAGSSQIPPNGAAALQSIVDDSKRECLKGASVVLTVGEVAALPLGKTIGRPTQRTRQVAATLRDLSAAALQPYEDSFSPDSDRARRLGLKLDQVLVELTCPPAGA